MTSREMGLIILSLTDHEDDSGRVQLRIFDSTRHAASGRHEGREHCLNPALDRETLRATLHQYVDEWMEAWL